MRFSNSCMRYTYPVLMCSALPVNDKFVMLTWPGGRHMTILFWTCTNVCKICSTFLPPTSVNTVENWNLLVALKDFYTEFFPMDEIMNALKPVCMEADSCITHSTINWRSPCSHRYRQVSYHYWIWSDQSQVILVQDRMDLLWSDPQTCWIPGGPCQLFLVNKHDRSWTDISQLKSTLRFLSVSFRAVDFPWNI
jgi:hypothetical protein